MILALAGGIGGAKLVHGLTRVLDSSELVVVVNTGDDFEHLGLHISPDLDTVMYTVAGLADKTRGWGVSHETWSFMSALELLGGPTWFRLGDKDLATHIQRTSMLKCGASLSAVTASLCHRLGINHTILPMSDDPVHTSVRSGDISLDFQEYFVRRNCEPVVDALAYRGAEHSAASKEFAAALMASDLEAIVICPSNPHLSIAPILAIPRVKEAVRRCPKVIAVSPIVGGVALKGPAAKIMRELGLQVSPFGIASYYAEVLDTLVIDHVDAALASQIESLEIEVAIRNTVMRNDQDRENLATDCLRLIRE